MKKDLTIFKTCFFLILFTSVRLFGAVNACNLPESVSVSVGSACPGEDVSFQPNVVLANLPINDYYYQWSKDGLIVSDASLTSEFLITNVTSTDVGNYCLKVSEGHPDTSLCFMEACTDLFIGTSTEITSQPQDVSICIGSSASFSVVADGDNLTYQWWKGSTVIVGETSSTFTLSNVTLLDVGDYTVEVTGTCGTKISDVAQLNAIDTEIPIVSLSVDKGIVCQGDDVMFTASPSGGGANPTYEFFNGTVSLQGPSAVNAFTLLNVPEDMTINVEMTSNSFCLDPAAVNPVRDEATIKVIEPATATITEPIIDPYFTATDNVIGIIAETTVVTGVTYVPVWSVSTAINRVIPTITSPNSLVTDLIGLTTIDEETVLEVTIQDEGMICPAASAQVTIIRKDITIPLIAQKDICIDQLAGGVTITGNTTLPSPIEIPTIIGLVKGKQPNAAGGLVVSGSSQLTIPTNTPAGDYTAEYQIFNNVTAITLSDTASFTIYDLPTASDAGTDIITCSESINLQANVPTIGAGLWTCETGTLSDPTNSTSQLSGLISGITTTCTWTTSNDLCPSSSSDVQIQRIGDVTTPNIFLDGVNVTGQHIDVCISDVKTVEGTTPLSGFEEGRWEVLSGISVIGVEGTDPNQGMLTLVSEGLTEISWTITSPVASCAPESRFVQINVINEPTVEMLSVSTLDTCDALDITIITPELEDGEEGEWVSDIKPTGSSREWIVDSADLFVGENVIIYAVSNTGCDSVSISETINIRPEFLVDASSDGVNPIVLDQFIQPFQLIGDHDGVSAFWSFNSTSLFFDDITDPKSVVRAFADGRYFATLNATDGKCTYTDAVEILIGEDPTGLNQIISLSQQSNLFIEGLEDYESIELSVFDLNGKQIEQTNLAKGVQWKPESYNLGTYVYRVTYDESKTRNGVFILIE